MRLGISSWSFRKEAVTQAMERVSSLGIRYVELFANRFHLDPRLGGPDIDGLTMCLKRQQLTPLSLHLPFAGIEENPGSSAQKVWLELVGACFVVVEALGIPAVVIHPYVLVPDAGGNPVPVDIVDLVKEEVLPLARSLHTRVMMENLSRLLYPLYWRLDHFHALLEDSKTLEMGLCFDVSHCICSGLDPVNELRPFIQKVREIHLSDNVASSNADLHLPLDRGGTDWAAFFRFLTEQGFEGDLMMEIDGGDDPGGGVGQSVRIIRDLLGNL